MIKKIIHIIGSGPSKDLFKPDGNEIICLNGVVLRTIKNPDYIVVSDHKFMCVDYSHDLDDLMQSRPKVFFAHKKEWSDHPAFCHIPNPFPGCPEIDGYNTCVHAGIHVAADILNADIIVLWVDLKGGLEWDFRWQSDMKPFMIQLQKELSEKDVQMFCGSEISNLAEIMPVWKN